MLDATTYDGNAEYRVWRDAIAFHSVLHSAVESLHRYHGVQALEFNENGNSSSVYSSCNQA